MDLPGLALIVFFCFSVLFVFCLGVLFRLPFSVVLCLLVRRVLVYDGLGRLFLFVTLFPLFFLPCSGSVTLLLLSSWFLWAIPVARVRFRWACFLLQLWVSALLPCLGVMGGLLFLIGFVVLLFGLSFFRFTVFGAYLPLVSDSFLVFVVSACTSCSYSFFLFSWRALSVSFPVVLLGFLRLCFGLRLQLFRGVFLSHNGFVWSAAGSCSSFAFFSSAFVCVVGLLLLSFPAGCSPTSGFGSRTAWVGFWR